MTELTDELKAAFIAAAGWQAEPWRFNLEVVNGLVAVLAAAQAETTEYTLSGLPEDHIEASLFQIKVAYRGRGKWAVIWRSYCINRRGVWDWEPLPSSRIDRWLAGHRFELDEALRLARKALPKLTMHGQTAAEVLANDQAGRS